MRLQTENLTKSFGEKQVLKGVSFSVESGRALGLLGRNVLRYKLKAISTT